MDIEFEFKFKVDANDYKGSFLLGEHGKLVMLEVESNNWLRPLDVEKMLYQVAHLLAEKTRTLETLREEKLNVWN